MIQSEEESHVIYVLIQMIFFQNRPFLLLISLVHGTLLFRRLLCQVKIKHVFVLGLPYHLEFHHIFENLLEEGTQTSIFVYSLSPGNFQKSLPLLRPPSSHLIVVQKPCPNQHAYLQESMLIVKSCSCSTSDNDHLIYFIFQPFLQSWGFPRNHLLNFENQTLIKVVKQSGNQLSLERYGHLFPVGNQRVVVELLINLNLTADPTMDLLPRTHHLHHHIRIALFENIEVALLGLLHLFVEQTVPLSHFAHFPEVFFKRFAHMYLKIKQCILTQEQIFIRQTPFSADLLKMPTMHCFRVVVWRDLPSWPSNLEKASIFCSTIPQHRSIAPQANIQYIEPLKAISLFLIVGFCFLALGGILRFRSNSCALPVGFAGILSFFLFGGISSPMTSLKPHRLRDPQFIQPVSGTIFPALQAPLLTFDCPFTPFFVTKSCSADSAKHQFPSPASAPLSYLSNSLTFILFQPTNPTFFSFVLHAPWLSFQPEPLIFSVFPSKPLLSHSTQYHTSPKALFLYFSDR